MIREKGKNMLFYSQLFFVLLFLSSHLFSMDLETPTSPMEKRDLCLYREPHKEPQNSISKPEGTSIISHIQQKYPLIKSENARIIVAAYEQDQELLKHLLVGDKNTPFFQFRTSVCACAPYNDLYELHPNDVLFYGINKQEQSLPQYNRRNKRTMPYGLIKKLVDVCFNCRETIDTSTLLFLYLDQANYANGFFGLITLIVLENGNIELFKQLLQNDKFKQSLKDNAFIILYALLQSNIDIETFKEALKTDFFDTDIIVHHSQECHSKHKECRLRIGNLYQNFNKSLGKELREFIDAKLRTKVNNSQSFSRSFDSFIRKNKLLGMILFITVIYGSFQIGRYLGTII